MPSDKIVLSGVIPFKFGYENFLPDALEYIQGFGVFWHDGGPVGELPQVNAQLVANPYGLWLYLSVSPEDLVQALKEHGYAIG